MSFKEKVEEFKKSREESKTFKKIVAKRTQQIRRQAFEKEALKQAEIKGRELAIAKANAPSFRQKVSRFAEGMSQVTTARTSSPPVRRVRRRKVVRVKAPVRRRRKIKKRVIRIVKRKHKRTSTRKPVIKRINPLAPTQNWRF